MAFGFGLGMGRRASGGGGWEAQGVVVWIMCELNWSWKGMWVEEVRR